MDTTIALLTRLRSDPNPESDTLASLITSLVATTTPAGVDAAVRTSLASLHGLVGRALADLQPPPDETPSALWRTEATIWTAGDPRGVALDELARASITGDAYCSHQQAAPIADPASDAHPPCLEFFGLHDDAA